MGLLLMARRSMLAFISHTSNAELKLHGTGTHLQTVHAHFIRPASIEEQNLCEFSAYYPTEDGRSYKIFLNCAGNARQECC